MALQDHYNDYRGGANYWAICWVFPITGDAQNQACFDPSYIETSESTPEFGNFVFPLWFMIYPLYSYHISTIFPPHGHILLPRHIRNNQVCSSSDLFNLYYLILVGFPSLFFWPHLEPFFLGCNGGRLRRDPCCVAEAFFFFSGGGKFGDGCRPWKTDL